MIDKIENLYEFVRYCEQVIEVEQDENDETSTDWLLLMVSSKLKKEELLEDITKTLDVYYKWQAEAVSKEFYILADVIKRTIEIELKHYYQLAKELKLNISKEITSINTELKTKHLDI
jgi:hypothetical protein